MRKIFLIVLVGVLLFGCSKNNDASSDNESDSDVIDNEIDQNVNEVKEFDTQAMTVILDAIVGEYENLDEYDLGMSYIVVTNDNISFGKRDEDSIAKDFVIVNYYEEYFSEGQDKHIFEVEFYDNVNNKESSVEIAFTLSALEFEDEGTNQGLAVTFSENDFQIGYIADAFRYEHYRNIKYN